LAVEAEFGLGMDLQSIGFDGFVARQAQTVTAFLNTIEYILDPFHFLAIPSGQAIKETDPVLICGSVDPLGVFFDFAVLFFKVL